MPTLWCPAQAPGLATIAFGKLICSRLELRGSVAITPVPNAFSIHPIFHI